MNYGYVRTRRGMHLWLDKQLRSVWLQHPSRIEKVKQIRFMKKAKDKRGAWRDMWHGSCEHCKKVHKMSNIEINHKSQVLSIHDNIGRYCNNLFDVSVYDLEALCKECHAIWTYMERSGLSYPDAAIEKKVIKFGKLTAPQQKAKLHRAGIRGKFKNKTERMDAVRAHLKGQ